MKRVSGQRLAGHHPSAMDTHAVYRFYDVAGRLLYIGQSRDPFHRWSGHLRHRPQMTDVTTMTIAWHPDQATAAAAERAAIRTERPAWNVDYAQQRQIPLGLTTATELEVACHLLRKLLADGPADVKDITAVTDKAGIGRRTLRRARVKIGAQHQRRGNGQAHTSVWSLTAAD